MVLASDKRGSLTSDLQGELGCRVDDFNEGDRILKDFLWQDRGRRIGNETLSPVVLQDNFGAADVRALDSVEACPELSFSFEEPVQWLVYPEEVKVSKPPVQRN